MRLLLLSTLFVYSLFAGGDQEAIDPLRPRLDALLRKEKVKDTDFKYPFLLSQTGVSVTKTTAETAESVRTFLAKGKLPIQGHYSKGPVRPTEIDLPSQVKTGKQLEGIKECTVEKCLMKLNTATEKKVVEAAEAKVEAYERLVSKRLQAFITKRELLGYEERESNREYIQKMLSEFAFFKGRYPILAKFFESGFWKNAAAPASLKGTSLRQELAVIAPDRLQPIWRIGEVFEFEENNSWVFFELHIYSNHYMDSSIRIYEVFAVGKKSALVITDIMEIDELTKSGLIRMLYKGRMEDAVSTAQNLDLAKIFP